MQPQPAFDHTAENTRNKPVTGQLTKLVPPYMRTAGGLVPFNQAQLPGLPAFLAGNPEEIVMTESPKVVITWMHTNEDHAPAVAQELYAKHPELARHVNYICGNPRVARTTPEKGFGDTDINRSFSPETVANPKTYEEQRAAYVLEFIKNADYVLDAHNTVCTNFGKLLILDEAYLDSPRIREIIAASSIKRIMVMGDEVSRLTLIGEKRARTVTLEYELGLTQSEAVPDTIATIEALVTGKAGKPVEREIFRVTGTVPKSEDPGLHVKNFEPFKAPDGTTRYAAFLGTGPRSYREDKTKDYCGYYVTMERKVL